MFAGEALLPLRLLRQLCHLTSDRTIASLEREFVDLQVHLPVDDAALATVRLNESISSHFGVARCVSDGCLHGDGAVSAMSEWSPAGVLTVTSNLNDTTPPDTHVNPGRLQYCDIVRPLRRRGLRAARWVASESVDHVRAERTVI